jgi:anti-sigma factor RsiW
MQTNDHPQDSIPAFVLGTLDIEEALLVSAHVMECPECRAETEAFQAVLGVLPYAAAPRHPPAHIKHQLLARIAAAAPAKHTPVPGRAPARMPARWMQTAAGGALALVLVFGMMLYNTNSQMAAIGGELTTSKQSLTAMNQQLARNQQTLAQLDQQHAHDQTAIAQISDQRAQDAQAIKQMQTQIARDQQVTVFISAPQTLTRVLESADRHARATIYMQPTSAQAVLVVAGMPPPAPGMTYQVWLAKPGLQVPLTTFDVSDDGPTVLQINAPAPISHFDQAMVTLEPAGGATQPSATIMLSGPLTAALPATSS